MSNTVLSDEKNFSEAVEAMDQIDIPDFQRSLVWSIEQKRNLLLSTVLRLPVGALSIGQEPKYEGENVVGTQQYLLDGQQRLDCIRKMLEPSIAMSWLSIKPPRWPEADMPAGDVAWKAYYHTEIMNLIYEYLGINFEDSDEYIEVTDSDDYARLGQEKIDAAEQAVKLEKGKEIAKLEYDAKKDFVARLDDADVGEELPFANDFPAIKTLLQLQLEERKKVADSFLEKNSLADGGRSLDTPGIAKIFSDLYGLKQGDGAYDAELFAHTLFNGITGINGVAALKPMGGSGTQSMSNEEKRVLRQKVRKTDMTKRIVDDVDEHFTRFQNYLELRETYKNQLGQHTVGWLTFKATNRKFTDYELAKVFELINMGGVPLSTIELLAVDSGWRSKLEDVDNDTFTKFRDISQIMGLHGADDDRLIKEKCTKWHLAAGFLTVLRKTNPDYIDWMLIFPDEPKMIDDGLTLKKLQQQSKKRTELIQKNAEASFKLLSLLKVNSVKNEDWKTLHKSIPADDWKKISEECTTLRSAGQALKSDDFFQNLLSFSNKKDTKANLQEIFGLENAARFFVKMMLIEWEKAGPPPLGSEKCTEFCYTMRRWFDIVLYESVTRYWVGTADQKLIERLNTPLTFEELNNRVNEEKWKELIEEMFDERTIATKDYVRNQKVMDGHVRMGDQDSRIRSILIYHQVLQGRNRNVVTISGCKDEYYEFHVDHIVSRKDWEAHLLPHANQMSELYAKNWCNSIANLTLLGFDTNTSKGADAPSKYFAKVDPAHQTGVYFDFIKEQLTKFGNIPDEEDIVNNISKCEGIEKLKEIRREKFVTVFAADNRKNYLFE